MWMMTARHRWALRPARYVIAAAVLSGVVGYLREGGIGGGLALAFAGGVGMILGILVFEAGQKYV